MFLRLLAIPMALVFLFAAAVQYNDPDPRLWAPVYVCGAFACGLAAAGRLAWPFPAVLGVATLIWAATILPRVAGKVDFGNLFDQFQMSGDPAPEEAREMLGLVILGGFSLVLALAAKKRWIAATAKSRKDSP